MLIYVIVIEQIECLGNPLDGEAARPCRFYRDMCRKENHRTTICLKPRHWAFTEGAASAHLVRLTKDLRKEIDRAAANRATINHTGVVHALVADTDTMKPMFDEAEQAAYRIGGIDAVRTLRKSQRPPKSRKPSRKQ